MKHIDAARWPQLSPRLDELLELAAPERAARLAQLRASDAALADELAALLAQQTQIDREGFLAGSALGDATLAGQTLGAYTLEQPIGAGGMGSVWLARRSDGRYEGRVAVKLLNLALVGRGGAERFAREGQVLARLAHPNIARLLDAGVTGGGQPYLVLEHVEGEPIDRWCETHGLGVDARLRLLLEVLAAVAHAHARLVLHRDLKPGNILVAADGRVKLLDFGIAKLLDDGAPGATALTALAGRAFTPDYAAPEQVEGGDASTATDVYALGVLLYVLLAGAHPTGRPTDSPSQRLRGVVETEPRRLSDAAPAALAGRLRGDLDTICAKALKKLPAERYPTVDALADDLRRFLADEPIAARRDAFAYRAAKFARRHRVGVAAAAVTLLALVGGVVGTAWQAVEAGRQRADALRERDRAQALLARNEAIVGFVDLMFGEALPTGQAEVLRRMLERSERLIDTAYAADPAAQAEILRVLGSYYTTLDLPNKQVELLARARGIVERVPDRSLQARLACSHAQALALTGDVEQGLRAIGPWLEAPDIEARVAAHCLQTRAVMAQAAVDPQSALRFAEAGLRRLREAGEAAPLLEATLLGDVAFAQHLAGHNSEADRSYHDALERLRTLGRQEGSEAIRMLIDRGIVRYAMSDFQGGLELFDRALAIFERRGEAGAPPGVLGNRAFGLEQLSRHAEALQAYERTFEAAKLSGFVGGQAFALVGRAAVQAAQGRLDAAQASLDEAAAPLQGLPAAHPARIRQAMVQAGIDAGRGELARADAGYGRVIEQLSAQGATTPAQASAHRLRAELALRRGEPGRAREDAEQAFALARRLQGDNPRSDLTGLAALTLARVLRQAGEAARAGELLRSAQAELRATLGETHPDTLAATRLLDAR